jgi:hypothetical protein
VKTFFLTHQKGYIKVTLKVTKTRSGRTMEQRSLLKGLKPPEGRIVLKVPVSLKRRFERAVKRRGHTKKFVLLRAMEDYIEKTESMETEL